LKRHHVRLAVAGMIFLLPAALADRIHMRVPESGAYWSMSRDIFAPLSPEEFASLREVGKGRTQRPIPAEHRERLMSLGFIAKRLVGFGLTHEGYLRLAAGK
jgi:hypothetical protein